MAMTAPSDADPPSDAGPATAPYTPDDGSNPLASLPTKGYPDKPDVSDQDSENLRKKNFPQTTVYFVYSSRYCVMYFWI